MLRPDTRKQFDVREYQLSFPSRLGVTILNLGNTIVQAVAQTREIPPTSYNTGMVTITSPFEKTAQFFVERCIKQLLPPSTLLSSPHSALHLTVKITTLSDDGGAPAAAVTAAAAAILSLGLAVQFIPVCVLFSARLADPTSREGITDLFVAFDKSGSVFLALGECENLAESVIGVMGVSQLSSQMEEAVQAEGERRRVENRLKYVIQ